ncbi:hypothetical protein EDB89DRAFT_953085 [Lactarius sanguifluus]|nr:hypothetical protein EDB89DRAFT_953085 [Lactarius sanguifluus]
MTGNYMPWIMSDLYKDLRSLPAELWLHVFRFATSTPTSLSSHYEPFQSCHNSTAISDAALGDKRSISLVCKQWRILVRSMLYEDIRIGRGIPALHAALDTPDPDGYSAPRYHVRRAVLPYASTATPTKHAPPALALLALLPQLEVLVRPLHACSGAFDFPPPDAPALPALRRLEWAFDWTGNAARTGGINALDDVLRGAPVLHELVLVGPMPLTALRQHRLSLRALHTLVLADGAAACPLVARQISYWALPALETLVLRGPARVEALEPLAEVFARQVRVLELGPGVSPLEACKIVGAFPALEELNVLVGGAGGALRACAHPTLQRVGVGVGAGEWDSETWSVVVEHVQKFVEGCPALHDVVLYALDVRVPEDDPQFQALCKTLSNECSPQAHLSKDAPIQSAPLGTHMYSISL